jgi:acetyltransferase-like isoleucine patch superfamily enzyme
MNRVNYIWSQFLKKCRFIWIRRNFEYLDLTSVVSPKAIFYGSKGISLGPGVIIHPYATIQCTSWKYNNQTSGKITIGEGTIIQPYAYLWSEGGNISIGRFCSINPFCILYGQGGLTIGNYVRIATHTVIIPGNHNFDRVDIPIAKQGNTMLGVIIRDDVWIGAGVYILDGVEIAEGCVLGAGSVVTKSTVPYGIYVGVPAKRIKDRGPVPKHDHEGNN